MKGQLMLKRTMDFTIVLLSLPILLPIMGITAFLVYRNLGGPIFFTQQRVGKNGEIFKLIKFRTMLNTVNQKGRLLSDEERLTTFGKILRSTSLDELPELWNIIKGDMSLVGPRPLLVEYKKYYSKEQNRRHDVRPGLTGWAQINGRNDLSWKERFKLDVWYVDHFSLWLDLKIIFLTFWKVLKREGINQEGQATMERFNGTN